MSDLRTPYGDPGNKFSQGPITVGEALAFPEIQQALANMSRWTPAIKKGVAKVLSNRSCYNRVGATGIEDEQFDRLLAKVSKCMDKDKEFAALMDPCYVFVDFAGAPVPTPYREWLDDINAKIGGSSVGEAEPGKFNVTANDDQPIKFVDPNMNNLNLLHVNTREHADFLAAELKSVGGLSSWIFETEVAPTYC